MEHIRIPSILPLSVAFVLLASVGIFYYLDLLTPFRLVAYCALIGGSLVFIRYKKPLVQVVIIAYSLLAYSLLSYFWALFSLNVVGLILILIALVFVIMRIDAKFLWAIAGMGALSCPFSLAAGYTSVAESMAVFAYYCLALGVAAQICESIWRPPQLELKDVISALTVPANLYWPAGFFLIIGIVLEISNHFNPDQFVLVRYLVWYAVSINIIILLLSYLTHEKTVHTRG